MTTQAQPKNCMICGESKIKCHDCGHGIIPDPPDQNPAYSGKLREIAEMLAFLRYKRETYFGSYFTEEDKLAHWNKFENKDGYINGKMGEAVAMVAQMEQIFKDGFNSGMQLGLKDAGGYLDHKYIDELSKELSHRGLIPQTKTDDNV